MCETAGAVSMQRRSCVTAVSAGWCPSLAPWPHAELCILQQTMSLYMYAYGLPYPPLVHISSLGSCRAGQQHASVSAVCATMMYASLIIDRLATTAATPVRRPAAYIRSVVTQGCSLGGCCKGAQAGGCRPGCGQWSPCLPTWLSSEPTCSSTACP